MKNKDNKQEQFEPPGLSYHFMSFEAFHNTNILFNKEGKKIKSFIFIIPSS